MSSLSSKTIGNSKNILQIQTVQIAPFRTLMTALKDILLETNISFTPEGIKIINMDKSHTILAHLSLHAKNFEHYECSQPKIVIGVNMFHLFKLINTIDNDDTLTIYIEEDDYTDGIVQSSRAPRAPGGCCRPRPTAAQRRCARCRRGCAASSAPTYTCARATRCR